MTYLLIFLIISSVVTEILVRALQYWNAHCKDFNEGARAILFIAFVSWLGLGLCFFPDAPLKICGICYCGKFGRIHEEAEYNAFMVWQNFGMSLLLTIFAYLIFGRFLKKWRL